MTPDQLLAALQLGEDQEVEFKSAAGGLPKSLWETLSACANTNGGWLVLGVAERNGGFEPEGLRNPQALLKAFWDNHNNTQKLSFPVCREQDVTVLDIDNAQVISIRVPRVTRQQRPVFINGNPLTGTFKRNYEGDYRCIESEVRRMLREAEDEPLDAQVLDNFDAGDLDRETLAAFRNRFSARHPDHPFLALDEQAFLESLGAWARDRNERTEGLTLAGLLMFGRERSLLDALPRWFLDYREQLSSDPEVRWTYRLTPDGTWAPNLFNFYYRVMPRLVDGIATPFRLDKHATRVEETHVHEALREALVNTLVHADHRASQSIRVAKHADAFIFENPGLLRVPRDQLLQGRSDPRNANLLKMFQLLGLGERAGSGFQKIMRAWREQHWLEPLVSEDTLVETTRVWLPVASMIPEDVERELRALVGSAYPQLDELSRVILVLAHRAGGFSNEDVQQYRKEHPRDIGARLAQLAASGWLSKVGHGRGTRYHWPVGAVSDLLDLRPVEERTAPVETEGTPPKTPVETPVKTPVKTPEQILAALTANPELTLAEIALRIGKSVSAVERAAAKLVKEGLLRFVGPRKGGKWEVLK